MKAIFLTCLLGFVFELSDSQTWQCPIKADIVFVLDGSDSVISREWIVFKESVITMISGFNIDQYTGVTVGCVVFASQVDDTVPLRPFMTQFELTSRIRKLKASRTGTGTSKGLNRMRQLYNTQGRQGVQRIGILIVDGNSRDMVQAQREADLAKSEGTILLVVGVGNDFEDKGEIRRLATKPTLAFESLDFFALRDISRFLAQRFCEEIQVIVQPQTTTTPVPTTTTTVPTTTTTTPAPTTTTTTPAPTTTTTTPVPTTTPAPTTPAPTTTTTTTPAPTTTTTTPAPTTTTTTPAPTTKAPRPVTPMILPPGYDPCDGCRIVNGIGYNNHPYDCSMYVQCHFPFGVAVAKYRSCSEGTFWDQDALTCRLPMYIACTTDPCLRPAVRGYRFKDNCVTYWSCNNLRTTIRMCCRTGERYLPGQGCVPDTNCTDPCLDDSPVLLPLGTTLPTVRPPCPYIADPNDPTKYQETWGTQTYVRSCAPGTEFATVPCRCEASLTVHQPSPGQEICGPEIQVTFKNGITDTSGNEFTIGVDGVRSVPTNGTTDGFAGYFDGQSRLLMYRFDNAYFSDKVAIYVRYKEESVVSATIRDEVLLANSDCGITPSIKVGFNRDTTQIFGTVNVGSNYPAQVSYTAGEWKEVTYIYNGTSLELKASSFSMTRSSSVPVSGFVARKQCALHVGYGQDMSPFIGWIDEIRVYLCIPDQIP